MIKNKVFVVLLAIFMAQDGTGPASSASPSPISALLQIDDANYTGGLSRKDRALAESVVAGLRSKFPYVACAEPDFRSGELVGLGNDKAGDPRPSLAGVDPDLAVLIGALDNPRHKVRDLAAYTIGLLGPSAKDAQPVLSEKFSQTTGKGGWYNDAFEKVSCDQVVAGDFRRTLPDDLLPPETPWTSFLSSSAVLMAKLYLDEDIEYPPGMMGYAYGNYAIADFADAAVPLFAQILENDRLSPQKHIEAAQALSRIPVSSTAAAIPGLLRRAESNNYELRHWVGTALVRLHHEKAVDLLADRVRAGALHWSWERELCNFGSAAISAQDVLIDVGLRAEWQSNLRAAVTVLGCMRSTKAIASLMPLLELPDWVLSQRVATALGRIDRDNPEIERALTRLVATHWSARVRKAAMEALLGSTIVGDDSDNEPQASEDDVVIVFGGRDGAVDHGLPWCDDRGLYSLDGNAWYPVEWIWPSLKPIPQDFPAIDLPEHGTREFFRVEDGWLFGSNLGHYDGSFAHVSKTGEFTELNDNHAQISGFFRQGSRIFAFGYEILKTGEGGSLFEVMKSSDGHWSFRWIGALPGDPVAYAAGLNGELLLSDGANDFAIVADDVVPLKCELVRPGSYFQ